MGTPLMDSARRILNARQEGMVEAVILLYDKGCFNAIGVSRTQIITGILQTNLGFSTEDIDYWLDWFGVKE